MWIKFIKTYSGPLGVFAADTCIDLPASTVKQLDGDCYQKCRAPWESNTDPVVKTQVAASQALQQADVLQATADAAQEKIESLTAKNTAAKDEASQAKEAAEKTVKAADDAREKANGKNEKKKANGLLRKANELISIHSRKEFAHVKVFCQLRIAIADVGLAQLDADEAMDKAEKLHAIADEKATKAKNAKAKKDEEATATDGPVENDDDAKGNDDTGGPTDQAGQETD